MNKTSAVSRINKSGALLVFPINNRPEPRSLWSEFFPKSKMRWEWDSGSDNRVSEMWSLMKRLSDCGDVVYSKWYQGRATFFSRELFVAMLAIMQASRPEERLPRAAVDIFETLQSDSPLSTKELKKLTDLQGRANEPVYSKAMKELFARLLIVGFGEVDDGAFPSLAVGSTQNLYEDLWNQAKELTTEDANMQLEMCMPAGSSFRKFFDKTLRRKNI